MAKQVEDYDSEAIRTVGERLLPHSVEQARVIVERIVKEGAVSSAAAIARGSKGLGRQPMDG